jgi:hypothetical protein
LPKKLPVKIASLVALPAEVMALGRTTEAKFPREGGRPTELEGMDNCSWRTTTLVVFGLARTPSNFLSEAAVTGILQAIGVNRFSDSLGNQLLDCLERPVTADPIPEVS